MDAIFAPCSSCGRLNRVAWEESMSKEPICGACKTRLPIHFGVAEVSGDGLRTLVQKSSLPVICDFWAPWCGPCKAFAPTYQAAARRLAGRATFAKLDTEKHPQAGGAHGVRGIPTLIVFRGGKELARISGALPLEDFLSWLDSALGG